MDSLMLAWLNDPRAGYVLAAYGAAAAAVLGLLAVTLRAARLREKEGDRVRQERDSPDAP